MFFFLLTGSLGNSFLKHTGVYSPTAFITLATHLSCIYIFIYYRRIYFFTERSAARFQRSPPSLAICIVQSVML